MAVGPVPRLGRRTNQAGPKDRCSGRVASEGLRYSEAFGTGRERVAGVVRQIDGHLDEAHVMAIATAEACCSDA